jgi:hypothetical protein
MSRTVLSKLLPSAWSLLIILFATPVLAAGPIQFDTGNELALDKPYDTAQKIDNIYQDGAVYGKLEGTTPVDIYTFTPDHDGEQYISIMAHLGGQGIAQPMPVAVFADPTTATEEAAIQLPLPAAGYHLALLHQLDTPGNYREPFLFQHYSVLAEQTIQLKKDTKYYILVVPSTSGGAVAPYAIKFGTGKVWHFKDLFTHFGSWLRLQTNAFAKTSPFGFNSGIFGYILLFLGLPLFLGTLILQELFALLANKSKSAGYLLIKMQTFSRIMIWVGLWFMAIGAYIVFDRLGWIGIPFVLVLLFLVIVANMLYVTLSLSRRVTQLEVVKKESTIPFDLRKRWFFSTLISVFSIGAFIYFLSLYLAR